MRLATVLLFGTVALLGRRMERGDLRPREAHAVAALCALLASGVAAVTGFVLLP
jgi:nitrate reductase gamma subunit